MRNISAELREKLIVKGASIVGYSDLSNIPNDTKDYAYGVSIAVALNPEVILGIGNGPTIAYHDEYIRVNNLLDELAIYAGSLLEEYGFRAFPMSRDHVIEDEKTRRTPLPHKTVATRSGVGWIGKCALLVTEQFGSAVRITSVLTNAKLETSMPINESKCGSCMGCKEACPANAVKGVNWSIGTDRDIIYNAFDCRRTARALTAKLGINVSLCGLCIYVCPWTKRYLEKHMKEA